MVKALLLIGKFAEIGLVHPHILIVLWSVEVIVIIASTTHEVHAILGFHILLVMMTVIGNEIFR